MAESFAPPSGPPPRSANGTAGSNNGPARQDSIDGAIPDEPPPAYTPAAASGDTSVQAGPGRMDFSGPPPMPDRIANQFTGTGLPHNITGVGEGYGRRTDAPVWQVNESSQNGFSPQTTGYNPFNDSNQVPPPPQHPAKNDFRPSTQNGSSSAGPSHHSGPPAPQDLTPTEVPTPGRPLLRNGQILIYPKGYYCSKCYNTGYKANDPSNPHDADWRKYGKQYNSAIAHSFTQSTNPNAISTSSSANFQRPLPNFQSHAGPSSPPPIQNPYGHLPPPPGAWHSFPGQAAGGQQGSNGWGSPHPPMGPGGPMMSPGPGPMMAPPAPLHLMAGDPRIGGRLCWRCGGSGRETSFFGFDDGRCWDCRGLGRVF